MNTQRLDLALVTRGLARSRGHAKDLITSGVVQVAGRVVTRGSHLVEDLTSIAVDSQEPVWVARSAAKLQAALDRWPAVADTIAGSHCLDVGASTGGFTQVLLGSRAASVSAIDVGHDQLAPALRADPRVTDLSGTTVRGLQPDLVGGQGSVLVADLSFISLTVVAADLARLVTDAAHVILLVKPQFEVGRGGLGKGGIVTDPAARESALRGVIAACESAGLYLQGLAASPMRGSHGNVEYLMWAMSEPCAKMGADAMAEALAGLTIDTADS